MSKFYQCDKCSKRITDETPGLSFHGLVDIGESIDLCRSCTEKYKQVLINWLDGVPCYCE